jgi:uncharacterized flavoprotein (TIGR03862 family)
MAAERLAEAGVSVRAFERMPSVGRKFLLAGRGGLNLTHSEPTDCLLARYGDAAGRLAGPVGAFPAEALRDWCAALGVETFVGSSGRVFPKSLKASPLLRAWLARLQDLGVRIETRRTWTGFADNARRLLFETPSGPEAIDADVVVLALGGASWPRLGGDGGWVSPLEEAGISVKPLKPANCGFLTGWSPVFAQRFAGAPIKRAALSFEGRTARGEAVITADGIEGGLIYALSAPLRDAIERNGEAVASLDLRPDLDVETLAERLSRPRGKRSLSTHLAKTASLPPVAVALLREAGPLPAEPAGLSRRIKTLPLRLVAPKTLERAISTAGGVALAELDESFMLRRRPGVFLAGEMLDWEAPTGGYLLQACFATGRAVGDAAARWLAARRAA